MPEPNSTETDQPNPALTQTRTRTRPAWLLKFGIFALVCYGLGVWGLIDALVIYPKRGYKDSAFKLYEYLEAARSERELPGASVEDPQQELARLRSIDRANLTELEATRLMWLNSLARLEGLGVGGTLGPLTEANRELGPFEEVPRTPDGEIDTWALGQRTVFEDPRELYEALDAHWDTNTRVAPLAGYDLPSQWVFVVVGGFGGIYLTIKIIRVIGTTYRYDPAERRLTMPGGKSFTPDDVEEYDRRRWDKFWLYAKLKGDPKEYAFDLYCHVPLEDWLLEIERHTDFYEPPAEEADPEMSGDVAGPDGSDAAESPDADRQSPS